MQFSKISQIFTGGGYEVQYDYNTINTVGWKRVMLLKFPNSSSSRLSYGLCENYFLTRHFNNLSNEAYLISLCGSYDHVVFKVLNQSVNNQLFTKIRAMRSGNNIAIDVYYAQANNNTCMFKVDGSSLPFVNSNKPSREYINFQAVADDPKGEAVLGELDL